MKETVTLTGMVLLSSPVKEYDRRLELLTKERGRISAFAQGARKAGSALSACTTPFTYGQFQVYEGRSSYQIKGGTIERYFAEIAQDYDKTCYASYFAEVARYFTRENVEASGELLLLYITFAALKNGSMPLKLIRTAYELRMMQIQGQSLEFFECLGCGSTEADAVCFQTGGLLCRACLEKSREPGKFQPYVLSKDALYTIQFVLSAPLEKLYTFLVSETVLKELYRFMRAYLGRFLQHRFHSEDFLD